MRDTQAAQDSGYSVMKAVAMLWVEHTLSSLPNKVLGNNDDSR